MTTHSLQRMWCGGHNGDHALVRALHRLTLGGILAFGASACTHNSPAAPTATTPAADLSSVHLAITAPTVMVQGDPAVQASVQFAYPDGTTGNLTGAKCQLAWSSSAPSIATVSAVGLVTPIGVGSVSLGASCGTITGNLAVTVRPAFFVHGTVHESAPTQAAALPGARIEVEGGELDGRVFYADGSAAFVLPRVSAPGFVLRVKAAGYDDVRYSVVQLPRDSAANIALAPAAVTIPVTVSGSSPCTELQPWGAEYPFTGGNARLVTSFPVYHAGQIVVTELEVPYDIGGTALSIVRVDAAGRVIGSDSIESFPFPPLPSPGPARRPLVPGYNYVLLFTGDVGPICRWPYRVVFTYQR